LADACEEYFLFAMPNKEFKAEVIFGGKVEASVHESFEKSSLMSVPIIRLQLKNSALN